MEVAVEFEEYVRARGAALVRFAHLLTGDRRLAEDLTQEALARAYVRWRHIVRNDAPDEYVRRCVINARASWWRRRSNRERPAEVETGGGGYESVAGPEARAAERDALWREIIRLPRQQRAVVVLRYYEDLDDARIAKILNCSAVTVRTHAMRALAALRSAVAEPDRALARDRRAS
ncbi:SigE family RNA polymerase sigma factor [Actinocatenispora sera]|uniref:RNA polymerase subunit sigma-24 n=1 Tax=Actinocatenispora sera TaxID=390989 RepID=A0A810L378_9ACTN|nr:RNA polymerase subunit sigma-24 [Actinocatenispora sera]